MYCIVLYCIIITGLKVNENEDTEQAAMRLMKDKLNVNLHPMDIDSMYSAKKKTADSSPDVVITKIEVMRSKKNLRHHDDKIYINEQLTQRGGGGKRWYNLKILWCEYLWVATSACGGFGPPPKKI